MDAPHFSGEHQFLSTPTAVVTNARAMLNGVTYPIAAISSVRLGTIRANPAGWVVMLIAVICAFAKMWVLAFMVAVVGVVLILTLRRQFVVMLTTAGGESAAMKSADHGVINGIVLAINEAVVHQATTSRGS